MENGAFKELLFPAHFLRTDHLNQDLFYFLTELDYPKGFTEPILAEKKVLPPGAVRPEEDTWQKFYTPEYKAQIREKERILFDLFPDVVAAKGFPVHVGDGALLDLGGFPP